MLRREYSSFDYLLMLAMIALIIFGLIMIGSATRINVFEESVRFNRQLIFAILGLILFLAAAFIDYHFIARFYVMIYVVCIVLLVGALLQGRFINPHLPVYRWIFFGTEEMNIGIQPSEFAKIFMIIFLAKVVDKLGAAINDIRVLMFIGLSILLPFVLIAVQPSLSAAGIVLLISISVLFVGNVGGKYVLIAFAVLAPIVAFMTYDIGRESPLLIHHIFEDYQIDRIETLLNPEAATADARFQIERSIVAIGSGQLMGKGLYQGTITQAARLPEAETDFIISIIGEEFGFVGLMVVLLLILFIVGRCLIIAFNAPDMLGRLIVTGVAMKLAFQAFINVGVVTEILPTTGVPFPFLSYGGSSLWVCMIAVGLAINVKMSKSKSMFE